MTLTNPIDDEPMSPGCMKCEAVTGKSTCFPGPCAFYRESRTEGTKAYHLAFLDRIRNSQPRDREACNG